MKRSLKRNMYLYITLACACIIFFNRISVQTLLLPQLEDQGLTEMGTALLTCESKLSEPLMFRVCAQQQEPLALSSMLTHAYLVCGTPSLTRSMSDPACQGIEEARPQWKTGGRLDPGSVESLSAVVKGEAWVGVRRADQVDAPSVWLPTSAFVAFRDGLWAIRDRNLGYALPVILALLGFLTLLLTRTVLKPIRLLEANLSSLTSDTLGKSTNLKAPYVEYERIVETVQSLSNRLHESFQKARRFAADASHELRTPLTILRGNAEQLIHDFPVGSEQQVRMRLISEEIERLIDITEKLLLLSRADANSMVKEDSDFAISEFLNDLASDSNVFHPELKVLQDIQPDLVWSCDKRLIQQLIFNLYSNAVKYNVAGGWLRISLKSVGRQLVMELENTAADIPEQLPQLAFERFYRGNSAHSRKVDGLGLGLSICQEIAHLHDADLTLTVTPQSTVLLRLVMPPTYA